MTDMNSLEDELKEEFEMFSIAIPRSDVMDKLVHMCRMYRLSASKMVEEWVAFCSTKKLDREKKRVTIDTLDHLDRERLSKSSVKLVSKPSTLTSSGPRVLTIDDIDELEQQQNDVIDAYTTPDSKAASSSKKRQHTPESAMNKRGMGRSPVAVSSPSSQTSPAVYSTPSQRYASRGNAGEVVCLFPNAVEGSSMKSSWRDSHEIPLTVRMYDETEALVAPYKFMFQNTADKAYVLNGMIFEMGEKLKEVRVTSEYSHVGFPNEESVTVVGRICCDGNGRLNANSLLLEGSMETSSGRQVPLDVSNVPQFSLFPGQIVAMDGVNSSGRRFVAHKIHEGITPDSPTNALRTSDGFSLVIAAGPYSTSDNILYEPLTDLKSCLDSDSAPDVCILLGPFVDAKHTILEKGDIGKTYGELFDQVVTDLVLLAKDRDIELVLVPSYRDLHHHFVYPQPPFSLPPKIKTSKVHIVSDPCMIDIDGVIIGLTSTDILFHLGAEEISGSQQPTQMTDRISRLAQHILTQQNYYPLYPPHPDVPVDVDRFDIHCRLTVTPHLLVLPSDLRCFIKEVGSTVCVNPGRMAKGLVGGTYARVSVSRREDSIENEKALPSVVGQIIRV